MLNYIIGLVAAWLPIFDQYLIYLLPCLIIMFVPVFIRSLLRG